MENRLSNLKKTYDENKKNLAQSVQKKEMMEIKPTPTINKNTDKILADKKESHSPFKPYNSAKRIEDRYSLL